MTKADGRVTLNQGKRVVRELTILEFESVEEAIKQHGEKTVLHWINRAWRGEQLTDYTQKNRMFQLKSE